MATETFTDLPVWQQFKAAARQRRRDPLQLLSEYMNECLEIWEHQRLDDEIRAEARQSGYDEDDAVEIVKQHRREKRPRASS